MKKISFILAAVLLVACAKKPQEKALTILHTNDTHSTIMQEDVSHMGGYARRMGLIEKEREADPNLLLLDAGDFTQGTPYFNYYHGRVEIDAMNWMKYDAATLGNHEFDYGVDTLAVVLKDAQFPILCANYDVKGTPLEGLVKPYEIFDRNGMKVGVFGLGSYPNNVIDDDNFAPLKYIDSYEVAQQMADELHTKGCEVVVCLSHLGTHPHSPGEPSDMELVTKTRGIDVVIGGHSHELIADSVAVNLDGKEIPVRQMWRYGAYIGKIMLHLGGKNEK